MKMTEEHQPKIEVQNGLIIKYGRVKYMTKEGEIFILNECKNLKYRALILLMLDGGLRITEALNSKWMDFDYQKKVMTVYTIKEKNKSDKIYRKKDRVRLIPITKRLLDSMGNYWTSIKKSPGRNEYIFLSPKRPGNHISRKVVDKQLKKWMPNLSAHIFRHTFATKHLMAGTELKVVQKLLGHDSITSTEVYLHVPFDHLRDSVRAIEKRSLWEILISKFIAEKDNNVIPVFRGIQKYHIGRKKEIEAIELAIRKKSNLLLIGPAGVGKTHLTENLKHPNILRFDEMRAPKKFLGDLLIEFYRNEVEEEYLVALEKIEDKKEKLEVQVFYENQIVDATKANIIRMAVGNAKVENYVQTESIRNLLDLAIASTRKNEVTILIDDVTKITSSAITVLEKMKNHFHIIACARSVDVKKVSAFSNFKVLKIEHLNRHQSLTLIGKSSQFFMGRIKDYHAYNDHIWRQTKGNPLYILEMVEEFSKKRIIDTHTIRTESHVASGFGYSLLPILVMLIALTSVLRYTGRISGNKTDTGVWYAVAAFGLIVLYMARPLIMGSKRRNI